MLKLFFPSLPDVIFRQLDNEYENDRQGHEKGEEFAANI